MAAAAPHLVKITTCAWSNGIPFAVRASDSCCAHSIRVMNDSHVMIKTTSGYPSMPPVVQY